MEIVRIALLVKSLRDKIWHNIVGYFAKKTIETCRKPVLTYFGSEMPSCLIKNKFNKFILRYNCVENVFCKADVYYNLINNTGIPLLFMCIVVCYMCPSWWIKLMKACGKIFNINLRQDSVKDLLCRPCLCERLDLRMCIISMQKLIFVLKL